MEWVRLLATGFYSANAWGRQCCRFVALSGYLHLYFKISCKLSQKIISMKYQSYCLEQNKTSKFHREFMSPALFLFEVLKMGKLTRGPLVLYHLPKYWSRNPVIKNYFRILKKTHAYLQTYFKAPVKFQKDRLKTVVGVTGTRYLRPIRFCSIRAKKMSKKKGKRNVQGVPQSQTAALPRPQEEEETDKSKQAQIEQTYETH